MRSGDVYLISVRQGGHDDPALPRTSTGCSAPGGAGAPCSAARRRGSRARCRRGRASTSPCAATSSSTACTAHARISTSSGEPCSSGSPASIRRDERRRRTRARRRAAARAARGCRRRASAGRGRRAGASPASARSAAAICARLKNGTAQPSYSETSRQVAQVGERSSPAPRPSRRRRARAPGTSPSTVSRPARAGARAKWPISSWPGSWPNAAAISSRVTIAQLARAVHGPRAPQARPRPCGSRTAPAACAAWGTSPSRS